MNSQESESDLLGRGYPLSSSQLILVSHDIASTQESERDDASDHQVSEFGCSQATDEPTQDNLNQEGNIMQNDDDFYYYNPGLRSDTPISYRVPDHQDVLRVDDDGFSIATTPEQFPEEGGLSVEREPGATDVFTSTKVVPNEAKSSGSTAQVFREPLSSEAEASGSTAQVFRDLLSSYQSVPRDSSSPDEPSRSQNDPPSSNYSCNCPCHKNEHQRQPPYLLRQESSPAALMILFDTSEAHSKSQKTSRLSK